MSAQQNQDDDGGIVGRAITRVFGRSWSTSLYGLMAGASGIVAVVPDLPHRVHQLAAIVSAIGIALLGHAAKSKNVTGVDKLPQP